MVLGGLSLFGGFYGAWRRYPVGWDCWTVRRPFGAPTAKSADAQGGDAFIGKPCVDGLEHSDKLLLCHSVLLLVELFYL